MLINSIKLSNDSREILFENLGLETTLNNSSNNSLET